MNDPHRIPLTALQQGMLFHHLRHPGAGVDFEQIAVALPSAPAPDRLEQAWAAVAARHGMLRARLLWEGVAEPVAEVLDEAPLTVEQDDWRAMPAREQERALGALLEGERAEPRALDKAPLHRLRLVRTAEQAATLVWSFPHVLLDGRSFPHVLDELFRTLAGERLPATPARGFEAHAAHLAARPRSEETAFWRGYLQGIEGTTPLPFARATPLGESRWVEEELVLAEEETAALRELAARTESSLGTIVQGAWAIALSRLTRERSVTFGAVRSGRRTTVPDADAIVGTFINSLPVRAAVDPEAPLGSWLAALRADLRRAATFEQAPLVELGPLAGLPPGVPLFETLVVYDHASLQGALEALDPRHAHLHARLHERTAYPLTLYAYGERRLLLRLSASEARLQDGAARRLLSVVAVLLRAMPTHGDRPLGDLPLLDETSLRSLLGERASGPALRRPASTLHALISAQAARSPRTVAAIAEGRELTYAELEARANRLAHRLQRLGVGPDTPVGLACERGLGLPVAMLAIWKAGGAYVPVDPAYPPERLALMLEDSGARVVVTDERARTSLPAGNHHLVSLDGDAAVLASEPATAPATTATPDNLAYVIYTSGSTGRPKGVMVEHRNVTAFFEGMDERLGTTPGTWLAVTSLSFDISVLELAWTLARGFTVVLHRDPTRAPITRSREARPIGFSLFYFSSDESAQGAAGKYRLLLEGARFADRHGFDAVWTPERHFHAFGGLYPNPAVAAAAIATITERVQLRAGSCVLPLHHPARVAEEWAVVDNLSNGRVGLSVASGWQPNDFLLRPASWGRAKAEMFDALDQVRRLWRGEAVEFPGAQGAPVAVRTLPRPVQAELPVWVTAAGNPETFEAAGRLGANLLTHLLGQNLEELGEKIRRYREAWRTAGHAGSGTVSLMLHAFVGPDAARVRELVRGPMIAYLRSSVELIKPFAWAFPAVRKRVGESEAAEIDLAHLTPEEMEALLEHAFERYYETSGLFGTPNDCVALVDRLKRLDVDDVACLIDFGIDSETVLAHLPFLAEVLERTHDAGAEPAGIPALVERHGVTHLQCTPSMARMLLMTDGAKEAFAKLQRLMVGGEALSPSLAAELLALVAPGGGELHNMYGPTETTIWSTTHRVQGIEASVPLGRPIAGTRTYVLDERLRPLPPGAPGELVIAGAGVTRGYLGRPELTAERFVPDPFGAPGDRCYRTGDLAMLAADETLHFLGRLDHQVKVRGFRIEPGEIEARLREMAGVHEAVVVAREDVPGDVRLVAYVVPEPNSRLDGVALREELRSVLPEHLVPGHVMPLDRLPLTPNAKVDRRALPAPEAAAAVADDAPFEPPAAGLEEAVAAVWRDVLGVSRVRPTDNFFDLGGHSLLAIQAHRRLKEALGRPVSITDIFRFPTLRGLATHLGSAPGVVAEPFATDAAERAGLRKGALARRLGTRKEVDAP